eukprot:Hpha_TRINITY_DN15505_c1_g1::TRINITY_DN15505_c1_g1_i1::g.108392::m.108392
MNQASSVGSCWGEGVGGLFSLLIHGTDLSWDFLFSFVPYNNTDAQGRTKDERGETHVPLSLLVGLALLWGGCYVCFFFLSFSSLLPNTTPGVEDRRIFGVRK